MNQNDFIQKRGEHGCTAYHSLMLHRAGGNITMTFYHDPTHKSAMVWVFLDSKENGRDVRSVSVMGGAYTLRDDWGLSLWRDRARSVWDELVRDGWVCHAYGSTGHPR